MCSRRAPFFIFHSLRHNHQIRFRIVARAANASETTSGATVAFKQPAMHITQAVDADTRGAAKRLISLGFPGWRPLANDFRRHLGRDDGSPARISRRVIFDRAYDKANNKTGNVGP
jgi:hypothetical protein